MGDEIAQSNLANLLDDECDPPRSKEAVYWYKRAVGHGFASAAFNLAMQYRNLGKKRWYRHWLGRAASMGDRDAARLLRQLNRKEGKSARPR